MSKTDDKHSNSEEHALFRSLIGEVRPLRTTRRYPPRPKPAPKAQFTRREHDAVLAESIRSDVPLDDLETGEELVFCRAHISRIVFRHLRRGRIAVQEEIDLHGLTSREAREELHNFIIECSRAGTRCVRVVHGKGLGSGDRGPVLKASVNRWLRNWQEVLAFCSAPRRDGGTGAVYVLLRR